jgi:hypothetical protein
MIRLLTAALLLPAFALGSGFTPGNQELQQAVQAQAGEEKTILRLKRLVRLVRVRTAQRDRARRQRTKYRRGYLRLRRESVRRFYPTTVHALRLASVTYGVSYAALYNVGSCESHLYPFARNGQYRGVFQEGPMFERGPFGRAGFSVWDPYANAFTAAYTVAQQGWRQWACKP